MLVLLSKLSIHYYVFFFFNDTATTEIYTLSLHDALPIFGDDGRQPPSGVEAECGREYAQPGIDRKSTRLNSSHSQISYAVFCLKKKRILASGSIVPRKAAWSISPVVLTLWR